MVWPMSNMSALSLSQLRQKTFRTGLIHYNHSKEWKTQLSATCLRNIFRVFVCVCMCACCTGAAVGTCPVNWYSHCSQKVSPSYKWKAHTIKENFYKQTWKDQNRIAYWIRLKVYFRHPHYFLPQPWWLKNSGMLKSFHLEGIQVRKCLPIWIMYPSPSRIGEQ